jgi:pilus assembly protein FimV
VAVDRSKITQQAEKLVVQGKIDQAIAQYELLVRDNPRDMNTINKIGDLYSRIGKKREAILQFNKIGDFYARDGFFLKAIAIYKKIMKLDPAFLDAYVRLAELYAKQGLVLEARSQYQIVAQHCLKVGEVKKAIEIHQSMVVLDPADLSLRTTLADLMAGDGRPAEAADEYARIGAELDRKGKAKEARTAYQKAASLHPGSSAMAVRVAETHLAEGDIEGAMKIVRDSLKKGDNADLHALMAEIHLRASRPDDAVAELERAVTLSPTRYEFTIRLARARLKRGDAEAALRTIDSRCDALVRDGKGRDALAVVLEIPGHDAQPFGLRLLYKLADGLQDSQAVIRWGERLALQLIASGQRDEGRRLAERILSMSPADEAVRQRLEATRQTVASPPVSGGTMGDAPPAETAGPPAAEIPDAPNLEPEDEDFISEHMTEADVFMKYGLGDRAVEQLQAIVDRYPGYVPALHKLKEIHLEEGNREGARSQMAALVRAHLAAGSLPGAEECLAELRRFDPASPEIEPVTQSRVAGGWSPPAPGEGTPASEMLEDAQVLMEEVSEPEPAAVILEEPDQTPPEAELAAVDALLGAHRGPDAVAALRELADRFGSHPEIMARMRSAMSLPSSAVQTMAAGGGAAGRQNAGHTGQAAGDHASGADHEEEFMIDVEDPAPDAAVAAPSPTVDLMDLASEIDAALGGTALGDLMGEPESEREGHSLEEIVEAFKKGVEQQVSPDDYETHYNLAIAYKEMGLLEEAIGEFQQAARGPQFLVDCCSMLGLCFRERQLASLAGKWYRRGLEACNGRDDEMALGLRYDLAMLLLEGGQRQEAIELLTEVYGVNSKFRDVATRLRDLRETTSA